jgi:hypothetical protein
LVGFASFVDLDALADRAGLETRALLESFARVAVRAALAAFTARVARAALEAMALAAFEIVDCARFTGLADFVATLVALAFLAILGAVLSEVLAAFADLFATFKDAAGFFDFRADPRAALSPRFVLLVALRFRGTAAPESLLPTPAPSNEPCGKPQPISNCSAMRR